MLEINSIHGRLVSIVPFALSDICAEYIDWLNDPMVVRYSNQRFLKHTAETCRSYFESFSNSKNKFLKIIKQSDGLFIGTMTIYYLPNHSTADIGIMLGNKSIWREGFGQDSWDALLSWLLNEAGVRKVTAGAMRCNYGMIKLMESSGMRLEGVRPQQEVLDGALVDIVYYGKFSEI
jgi:RimJ/RimL family protein N-acetyltransferase